MAGAAPHKGSVLLLSEMVKWKCTKEKKVRTLSIVCGTCGTINRINQKYCQKCKQPLAPATGGVKLTPLPPVNPAANNVLLRQRYRLIQVLGRGGMGTVYLAQDMQLGSRLVAIKEMSQSGLNPLERQVAARNFQREANILAELQHPHLPSIHDHFEEENQRCYLVMSFIDGQTLEEYVQTYNGRLAVSEVVDLGLVLCDILAYLHNHQPPIIFRDLKPSNIMRTSNGYIYLIDFGIARLFKPGQAKDTANRGSSGYAPPEQYGRAQTKPSSDIYSLGATMYQLLSGYELAKTPFHLPPIRSLVPNIPTELATLITEMLDLDENKRPQSAHIVKQDLQNISIKMDQTSPVPKKERDKGLVLAVFTVILTLIIVLASTIFVLVRLQTGKSGSQTGTPQTATTVANTPARTVQVFCNAMSSLYPDFPIAYQQMSSTYQSEHTLDNFEENFQGTNRCVIVSLPNAQHVATLQLTMVCLPPNRGGPPPSGTPPPRGQEPPQKVNPATLTLVEDGNNGWKIDSIDLVRADCGGPPPFGN